MHFWIPIACHPCDLAVMCYLHFLLRMEWIHTSFFLQIPAISLISQNIFEQNRIALDINVSPLFLFTTAAKCVLLLHSDSAVSWWRGRVSAKQYAAELAGRTLLPSNQREDRRIGDAGAWWSKVDFYTLSE